MIKICMFAANYLPHVGGIENYTYHLARELTLKGCRVTVVTSNLYNGKQHEYSDDIEVYRMPCCSLIGDRYPVCKPNKEFKKIDSELGKYDFDFIIIHARFYFHSIYAAKFASRHKIPCFAIEHGSSHLSVNNRFLDFCGGIWEHMITAVLKKYCKHYYGVSKTACNWSTHFGIESEGVISPSVDINKIKNILQKPAVLYKKEYGISENATVISFIGRIIPEKGIVQLLDAIEQLSNDDLYLFVAGDGPLLNRLKEQYDNSRVIFLGQIDYEHVISLLKDTDIYCLPSVSEGMGISVLEAIASKVFVITTENVGAVEILSDSSYGYVMRSNTVNEIKKAIQSALDRDYRSVCIEKSYKRLNGNYTWEKTAEKVLEIIKKETGKGKIYDKT